MAESAVRQAEVTRLLEGWRAGRAEDLDKLLVVVYDELRRMARAQLANERRRHTFQATDLVHEAFARLVDQKAGWQNRMQFFAIAARCMRRILIDRARRRRALKRPRVDAHANLDEINIADADGIETIMAVDEALSRLASASPRAAQVAEMRIFAGLDVAELGELLGISPATVKRDWAEAKRYLRSCLVGGAA